MSNKSMFGVEYTKQIARYENINTNIIYKLQNILRRYGIETDAKETQSYYINFGLSKVWNKSLVVKGYTKNGCKNNSIDISTYMIEETDTPYIFHIWKYYGNNHYFNDKEYKSLDEKNLEKMAKEAAREFGVEVVEEKYEQLDMFAALGI